MEEKHADSQPSPDWSFFGDGIGKILKANDQEEEEPATEGEALDDWSFIGNGISSLLKSDKKPAAAENIVENTLFPIQKGDVGTYTVQTAPADMATASGAENFDAHEKPKLAQNGGVPGVVLGAQKNVINNYGEEKFHGARGHGFAAERANDLVDKAMGNDARILGDDNALNGADRIVNGTNIQSKYCKTGSKCIQECFRDGKFRYVNKDGSPMQIEVPSDKYEDALKAMQNRIDRGEIKGVKQAEEIVRKGYFTYEQAKNIARAGTIESLVYDSVNGAVTSAFSGGISAAMAFWCARSNGRSFDEALGAAVSVGLQVGGVSFASAVLGGQLAKAGLNATLAPASDAIVSFLGPKASATLVNAFNEGASVYGAAAMKSASKLLRSNAITGAITVVALSAGDILNIFRGRISAAQLFKNVTNTAAGVAGGAGGLSAGASAGASLGATVGSIVPGVGTAIGGAVGGFVGGIAGALAGGAAVGKMSSVVTDALIEDDSKEMLRILEGQFQQVANDYLLNEAEATRVADLLKAKLTSDFLKDMYAADSHVAFAHYTIESMADIPVRERPRMSLPTSEEMAKGLKNVLEAAS